MSRQHRVIAWIVASVTLLVGLGNSGVVAWNHLFRQGNLGSDEFTNATAILKVASGKALYYPGYFSDGIYLKYPYTPLYVYVSALLKMGLSGFAPQFAGRFVALLFAILCGGLLVLSARSTISKMVALLSLAVFACAYPTLILLSYTRPDMMALFFSATALVILTGDKVSRERLIISALLGVIAVATKQNYILGLGVPSLYFFIYSKEKWKVHFTAAVGFVAIFLGAAQGIIGKAFWEGIVSSHNNEVLLSRLFEVLGVTLAQPLVWLVPVAAGFLWVHRFRHRPRYKFSILEIYFLVSWPFHLLQLMKMGSGMNYLIEPIFAALLFVIYESSQKHVGRLAPKQILAFSLAPLCLVVGELLFLSRPIYIWAANEPYRQQTEVLRKSIEEISQETHQKFTLIYFPLEISDSSLDLGLYPLVPDHFTLDYYGQINKLDRNPLRDSLEFGEGKLMVVGWAGRPVRRDLLELEFGKEVFEIVQKKFRPIEKNGFMFLYRKN